MNEKEESFFTTAIAEFSYTTDTTKF